MQTAQLIRRFKGAIKRHGFLGLSAIAPRAAWSSVQPFLPGPSARIRRHREIERNWDIEHGIETCGVIRPSDLNACSENWVHGVRYQPTDPTDFHRLLSSVPLEHDRFVFIDIGSGKGRVLFLAAAFPFQRIIGVEYSRQLHADAQRNVLRRGMSNRIQPICSDVLEFSLPPQPLLIYLYHPFDDAVMRPFVKRVENSLRETPRIIWIFYLNSVHAEAWDQSPLFRRKAQGRERESFTVWQSVE